MKKLARLLVLACVVPLASACSLSRHIDGELVGHLKEPLPTLEQPLARSFTLDTVSYLLSGGKEGRWIGDSVGREIYFLPKSVQKEAHGLLNMDEAATRSGVLGALNVIARGREEARGRSGVDVVTSDGGGISQGYIASQEQFAREAYKAGDYLKGDIHSSAASNAIAINRSFAKAQATANLAFSVLGAASAVGVALVKGEYAKRRAWIETSSGAIGQEAPEGAHLNIFLLTYFNAKAFSADSHQRLAVYLTLTTESGVVAEVLETGDAYVCNGECERYQPRQSSVQLLPTTEMSDDMRKTLWINNDGPDLDDFGFDATSGIYLYPLLRHALKKLESKLLAAPSS